MLLAVKNRGQKTPQLLHRHQNSKNCTYYYSPKVLLIYKKNMHKKIKTNSCFPKKNQKEKKWKFALWEENRGLTNYS